MRKLNLKEAIEKGKLADFIKQNQDKIGDKERFDSTLLSMSKNSKSTHQTSTEDSSEN